MMTSTERLQYAIDIIFEHIDINNDAYGCAFVVVEELSDIIEKLKEENENRPDRD